MKRIQNIWFIFLLVGLFTCITFSQVKLAQTGLSFLGLSSDARSNGMGGAVNSLSGFSGAMMANPASMAEMPTLLCATFDMNTWIADIKYISSSVIVSPLSGDYGTIGLGVQYVDYGALEGTMVDGNSPDLYYDTGNFSPTALAVSLDYSKMISKQFGVGARVKYAYQKLGENKFVNDVTHETSTKENKATAIGIDFGTIYKTGIKSIAFGMSVTNFSKEIKFESEGFQLPLLFTIGVSANLFELINSPQSQQELLLAADWTHPRSHPEQLKVGAEYKFKRILSLRIGYVSGNDENSFTYGIGISSLGLESSFGLEVDYAYTPFGVFTNVQQLTARVSL